MSTTPGQPIPVANADSVYDLLFPQVPVVNDPSPPDVPANFQLVDDLQDFSADSQPNDSALASSIPTGVKSLAFDWDSQEFYLDQTGAPLVVTDEASIIEWCLLAANVPVGEYSIFSPNFGNGILDLIGAGLEGAVLYSEVARMIEEMYSKHPLITEVTVEGVTAIPQFSENAVLATITIGSVYSDNDIQLDVQM